MNTDGELVVALRGGDHTALASIYDRHAGPLHDMCARIGAPDEAADAVHDTFVTAMESLDQLRDPQRLRPWLFSIARNRVRRRGRRAEVPTEGLEVIVSTTPPPEAEVMRLEQAALIESALEGLDPSDREVVLLRDRYDLDGESAAEVLGVDRATVDSRLHSARRRLRQSVVVCQAGSHGSTRCVDLQRLRGDGPITPTIRKRVARHVRSCDICEETVERTASPAALLGSLPLLLPPTALRERVLSTEPTAVTGGPKHSATRSTMLTGAVISTVAVAAVAWLAFGTGSPEPEETGAPTAREAPLTTAPQPTAPPTTLAPTEATQMGFCDVLGEAQAWYSANPGPASPDPTDVELYFTGSLTRLQALSADAPDSVRDQLRTYTGAVSDLVRTLAPTWDLSAATGGPDLSALRDMLENDLSALC